MLGGEALPIFRWTRARFQGAHLAEGLCSDHQECTGRDTDDQDREHRRAEGTGERGDPAFEVLVDHQTPLAIYLEDVELVHGPEKARAVPRIASERMVTAYFFLSPRRFAQ